MKLFDNVSIATEVIDHQMNNQKFKDELISQIQQIKDKLEAGIYKSNNDIIDNNIEIAKIVDLILKRTGLKLQFLKLSATENYINSCNAFIHTFINNYMNPLLPFMLKSYIYDYVQGNENIKEKNNYSKETFETLQKYKNAKITVDLKNAKISGKISEYSHLTFVDFKGFFKITKATAGEVAGTLMHELGHAFAYIEFSNKIAVINQALYNIATKKKTEDKNKVFEIAYADLSKIDDKVTEKDIENMISDNTIIASFALYKFIAKNTHYENLLLDPTDNNSYYNSETMADVFAVRMGFAEEMNTMSVKDHKSDRNMYAYQNIRFIFITTIVFAVFGIVGMFGWLVFRLVMDILISSLMLNFSDIYKNNKERIQKNYNELVDSLKHTELSNDTKRDVINSLTNMKIAIDAIFVKPSSVGEKLVLAVAKNARIGRSYEYQQDLLEKLASNELFVKSVELELQQKGA